MLANQDELALRHWLDLLNAVESDRDVAALCFDDEPDDEELLAAQESARDSIHRIQVYLGDIIIH